jgi:hypothetical protein
MQARPHSALSPVAAVILGLVIVGAVAAVTLLALNSSPGIASSSSSNSTSSLSSSTTSSIESSSSLSSTSSIVTSSSSVQTSSYVTISPGQYVIFGVLVNPQNATTKAFPNDTLIWTNYVASASVDVSDAIAVFVTSPTTSNSTARVAFYVNGALLGQETYQIGPSTPPASQPNSPPPAQQVVELTDPLPSGTQIPSGATVSMAIWCSSSPLLFVNNDPNARGTYEAPLTTALPSSLPSATSSLSYNPSITTVWSTSPG